VFLNEIGMVKGHVEAIPQTRVLIPPIPRREWSLSRTERAGPRSGPNTRNTEFERVGHALGTMLGTGGGLS
jgi:hypothetical protein